MTIIIKKKKKNICLGFEPLLRGKHLSMLYLRSDYLYYFNG